MRQLCKGNVAVVKGAILAGCRGYYGYPITPASEIAEAAALGQAKAISTPFLRVHMGSALSQGYGVINGPQARALGPTGAGVAVGVVFGRSRTPTTATSGTSCSRTPTSASLQGS